MDSLNRLRMELERYDTTRRELEGEGVDGDFLTDTLEGATDLDEALSMLARELIERETLKGAIEKQKRALAERGERIAGSIETIRGAMCEAMQRANLPKLQTPMATLSLRNTPQKAVVTDADALPESLIRVKREPNLTAIKDALKSGETVPGATLSNGGVSLAIRKT